MLIVHNVTLTKRLRGEVFKDAGDEVLSLPFLFTSLKGEEFAALIGSCERPVYCMVAKWDTKRSTSFPNRSTWELMNTFHLQGSDDRVLMIPLKLEQFTVPVFLEQPKDSFLYLVTRNNIERCALFDRDHPDGFIDTEFVSDPFEFFETSSVLVSGKSIASTRDIAQSLWKNRNAIRVYHKKAAKQQLKESA